MKIVATKRFDRPIYLMPGDTFRLLHQDKDGQDNTVLSQPITKAIDVDVAHVIEFEDGDLGLEFGIGGVFGKEKK